MLVLKASALQMRMDMGSTKYLPNIIFPLYRTYVIYIFVNQNSVKLLFVFF